MIRYLSKRNGDFPAAFSGRPPSNVMRYDKRMVLFILVLFALSVMSCNNNNSSPEMSVVINSLDMRLVYVRDINVYVSVCEVTVQQYANIMKEMPIKYDGIKGQHPINNISSSDAELFCELLSKKEILMNYWHGHVQYQLPSYKEWVVFADDAALEGSVTPQGGLGSVEMDGPLPVMTGSPNKYGLYNIRGNVAEFSRDIYSSTGSKMILGGHYATMRDDYLDISNIAGLMEKDAKGPTIGFRVIARIEKGGQNRGIVQASK